MEHNRQTGLGTGIHASIDSDCLNSERFANTGPLTATLGVAIASHAASLEAVLANLIEQVAPTAITIGEPE